jgi:hypothetical protein
VKVRYNDVAEGVPQRRAEGYGSPMRRPALLLIAASAVLTLAACTQPEATPPTSSASGLPSFPRVAGPVLSQSEPNPGDWLLAVKVTDTAAAYREARSLLSKAGFQITNDAPASDGGNGQACTTALCVSFTAVTHPGRPSTVDYEVFHSTGVVG